MSSLTAVKAAIDLIDWKSADYAGIKKVVDDLLDSMDSDLEEVAFDESSTTEQFYGKLRKLLDEEDLKLMEDEEEDEDEPENGESAEEELEELLEGEEEDEDEDDIEYEDDDEEEVETAVETEAEKPTTE